MAGLHSPSSRHFAWLPFSASPIYLTTILPQSHDSSCYVSRPILAPPPLWQQKLSELSAHDFEPCLDSWHNPVLVKVSCTRSWRLYGINPAIQGVRAVCSPAICFMRRNGLNGQSGVEWHATHDLGTLLYWMFVRRLTFWHRSFTFKFWHTLYVKCE
jgi:hypothetical protein